MCLVEIGRPQTDRATGKPVLDAQGRPQIDFGPKLETSCTTPVSEGMVVHTATETVRAARRDMLEFLLTSHPLDCPVCDKGGECPLQNQTLEYGPGLTRFIFSNKQRLGKHVPLGDLIWLDQERCIQCARCVRFQTDVADDAVIGFYQRGRKLQIATFSEPGFDSKFSGNTTDICPVGALTTADFRFGARPWEMRSSASICTHCPVGCNTVLHTRREAAAGGRMEVKRVLPRQNNHVNDMWICDKGRFGYAYATHRDRLTQPMLRQGERLVPASWEQALERVRAGLAAAGEPLLVSSVIASDEDLFALRARQRARAPPRLNHGGGDHGPWWGVGAGTNLADHKRIMVVPATDLEEEAPIWWLRLRQAALRGATVVTVTSRPTKADRFAKHVVRVACGEEAATLEAMRDPSHAADNLRDAARAFAEAENAIVFFGSDGLGFEGTQAVAQAAANLLIATRHFGRPNNGLVGVWPRANTQGAWDVGVRPDGRRLAEHIAGRKALLIAGADPVGDNPAVAPAVRAPGFLVVVDLFLTETAKLADVILPAQSFAEREGTFTSGERRVQRFYFAVPPMGQSKPDWQIAAEIGRTLGLDMPWQSAAQVFEALAAAIPAYAGLNYALLSRSDVQWPPTGPSDFAFSGTAARNEQGFGVPVPSDTERGQAAAVHATTYRGPKAEWLALPVTRLYDRGTLLVRSATLSPRLPGPSVILHPLDADRLGVKAGHPAALVLNGSQGELMVVTDEATPRGVMLLPRSASLHLAGPTQVEMRSVPAAVPPADIRR
jgi:NADH-quinone oxidoreductase subunit G